MMNKSGIYGGILLPVITGGFAIAVNEPYYFSGVGIIIIIIISLLSLVSAYGSLTLKHEDQKWSVLFVAMYGDATALFLLMIGWIVTGKSMIVGMVYLFIFLAMLIWIHINSERVANALHRGTENLFRILKPIGVLFLLSSISFSSGQLGFDLASQEILTILYASTFLAIALFFLAWFHSITVKIKNPDWTAAEKLEDIDLLD
ncbi:MULTISPECIES: hypothetical protein [Bacillaceae]|uniref:Uncharacterized protein n=1 Tax=Evansella alkalicola TaxID=745819 RepID=A0ABS6K1P2_9BACI|nr:MULTISPECIES: hypothetical protein [Bacillaceae]MBU9723357.1 hypothetical protein [Bacillus alkalicola]